MSDGGSSPLSCESKNSIDDSSEDEKLHRQDAGDRSRKRRRTDSSASRHQQQTEGELQDAVRQQLCKEQISVSPAAVAFLHSSWRGKVTVPFLARYRRDQTGGLSETHLRRVMACFDDTAALRDRKEKILAQLTRSGATLTKEVSLAISGAATLSELESIYDGCRVKRVKDVEQAAARGLIPLAAALTAATAEKPLSQENLSMFASLSENDRGLLLSVVSQQFYLHSPARSALEEFVKSRGCLTASFTSRTNAAKAMSDAELAAAQSRFSAYNNFLKPVRDVRPHQFMAISRGADLGVLSVKIALPNDATREYALRMIRVLLAKSFGVIQPENSNIANVSRFVRLALDDAFSDHLLPHAMRLAHATLRKEAETSRVECFARNLRHRLLQRPLTLAPADVILAVDPGFLHGCKCVALSWTGELMHTDKFLLPTVAAGRNAASTGDHIKKMIRQCGITMIVVGNGTGCRETIDFLRSLLASPSGDAETAATPAPSLFVVSEGGASVYSASPAAAEELNSLDILYRGAVSIGRRLIDPLSELVKIPPQAVGVGQYQHDAKEKNLCKALEDEVGSCVALVGVNFDTCSKYVLEKLPGMSKITATKLIELREQSRSNRAIGAASEVVASSSLTRAALEKVMRTKKERQETIAFIRLPNSPEPLDRTSLHPEAYSLARSVAAALGLTIGSSQALGNPVEISSDRLGQLARQFGTQGLDQLKQAIAAISASAPVDPRRGNTCAGALRAAAQKRLEELQVGDELDGIVVSVTDFAAFVDVGAERDGFLPSGSVLAAHGLGKGASVHDAIAAGDSGRFVVASVDLRGRKLQLRLPDS
jgi:uncharacterized protein